MDELKTKLEDKALDRAQQAELRREMMELQRQIAADALQGRRDIANIAAAARTGASANKPPKPLPTTVIKPLNELSETAEGLDNSFKGFKPEYGGVAGAIDNLSGTWNPFSGKKSEEAANWWKDYNRQSALTERHKMFGTALSAGERTAWIGATIFPGMKPDVIAHNLKMRAKLAEKLYNHSRDTHIRGGYDAVDEAFPARNNYSDAAPAAPAPGALSAAEAAELKALEKRLGGKK
jgi:hypothetical protein